MKRLCVLLLFCGMLGQAHAQFDTSFVKSNVRRCADSLVTAFKTRNWDNFARYSYPAMVASLGGTQDFINYVSNTFEEIPDSAWKKYEAGKILQVVKQGRDYQAVIELNTIIEWQGTRTTSTGYLVGESWDGGHFWTFFDSLGETRMSKMINPNLSDALMIPARKELKEPVRPVNKTKPAQRVP